jgi:hypothetical protein
MLLPHQHYVEAVSLAAKKSSLDRKDKKLPYPKAVDAQDIYSMALPSIVALGLSPNKHQQNLRTLLSQHSAVLRRLRYPN